MYTNLIKSLHVIYFVSHSLHANILFFKMCICCFILDVIRFQILTDDQTKLVFEVKKDDQGKGFLLELNKAIEGELTYLLSY